MNELFAALEANPDDLESYRVLADELQTTGDPRGALIVMMIERALTKMPAKARLIDKEIAVQFAAHERALLGPLRKWTDNALWSPHWTWRHGFIHRLAPKRDAADLMRTHRLMSDVLAHPSGRLVGELAILVDQYQQAFVEVLAMAPPSVRVLELSIFRETADLSPLWPRLPRLTKLALGFAAVGQTLGTDTLPTVRDLTLTFHADIALSARWPALEKLRVWNVRSEATHQPFRSLCEHPPPRLTRLQIEGAFTRELFDLVMASPLGAQLHDLDFANGDLTDDAAHAWVAKPPAHRLKLLRVRNNRLSQAGIAALAAVADRVVTKDEP